MPLLSSSSIYCLFFDRINTKMKQSNRISPKLQKEKYYRNLTLRNTILHILMFVLPFLLLFFIINMQTSSLIKKQIYNRLSSSVEENIKTIKTFQYDREIDLKSYSKLNILKIEEVSEYFSFLNLLIKEKKWFDFIIIADLNGNIVLSINLELEANIATREYFQVSKNGKFYNSGIFYSDILNYPVMILSYPLMNKNNEIIGILAAALNLDNFYDLLFDLRTAKTSELFIVNNEGILLSPTKLGGRPLIDKGFYEKEENPHTGEKGIKIHTDYRGQKVLCFYKKLPESNFFLVSEIDFKEAFLPLKRVDKIILYVVIPFFIILVIISNLYSRRVTSLLRRLTLDLENALSESRAKKKEVDSINIELRKKAEESERLVQELKSSEEYIRNLIDSISFPVIGLNSSGKITQFNKEAKEFFPIEKLKMGDDIFSVLPWLDYRAIRSILDEIISNRIPQKIAQRKQEKGKNIEYYDLYFFPIEVEKKEVTGITLLIENVTERKKLREQLAEYEKLSALSQLAMGAAHEINNPLLGISSYLEIISEETENIKDKKEIELVLENVYRISETIRGLLSFARPTPPQFAKVNINKLIDETLSFLRHQPIFRKLKATKELATSLPPITADFNQIRQVLINMFINAAQSMPNEGKLHVKTSKVKFKEFIQIDISDTGEGIPLENIKKIFDPFFTTKKSQGTGLGLSISQSFIKNHNGYINLKSELNKGTTFSIFLPIRQEGRVLIKNEETIS